MLPMITLDGTDDALQQKNFFQVTSKKSTKTVYLPGHSLSW